MKCHFIEQFTKPDEKIRFTTPANFSISAADRNPFDGRSSVKLLNIGRRLLARR